jgi:hypothetical protein
LAVAAPAASGAERHASPAGTGTDCTLAAPCSLATAFDGSASGDEIVLAGGDYGSPAARRTEQYQDNWKALNVHPEPGGGRPKVWATGDSSGAVALVSPESRISDVDIDWVGDGPALWGNMLSVDRVRIESTGDGVSYSNNTAASASMSNTSIHATGGGSWGINVTNVRALPDFALELVLRNVTVVADAADSPALTASSIGVSGAKMATTVTVHNSILRGGASDIDANASGVGDSVTIDLDHSSFETSSTYGNGTKVVTSPSDSGNQSTAPVFVSAGDLRQAAGSPTIDAGAADPLAGTLDAWGDARVVGSAIDIGADEFVPAPPTDGGGSGGGEGSGPGSGSGSGDGSGPGSGSGSGDGSGAGSPGVPIPPASNGSGSGAGGSGGANPPAGPAARCVVPRLTGKTLAAARAALRKAGCATGPVKTKRLARKAGKVISQGTKPGTGVRRGTKIALVVARR